MTNVHPAKLAYRGVLIERPCVWCDTVDIHFEGQCNSGPCAAMLVPPELCACCDYPGCPHIEGRPPCTVCIELRNRPAEVCAVQRYGRRAPRTSYEEHGWVVSTHVWQPNTYYPDDFEWPNHHCNEGDCDKHDEPGRKGFHKILDKVRELGEPQSYTVDLFRDYEKLTGRGPVWGKPNQDGSTYVSPTRFVWKLRAHSCGTDLYAPGERIYSTERGDRFFLYDGRSHGPLGDFIECDLGTAQTMLATWHGLDKIERQPLCIGDMGEPCNQPQDHPGPHKFVYSEVGA